MFDKFLKGISAAVVVLLYGKYDVVLPVRFEKQDETLCAHERTGFFSTTVKHDNPCIIM